MSEERIDVKPQDTSRHTVQVDSIDIMDVDSNNNEGYALCGNSSVISLCVHVTLLRPFGCFLSVMTTSPTSNLKKLSMKLQSM